MFGFTFHKGLTAGMIFLFLTVLSSTTIALLLKLNDVKKGNALVLLAGNYAVAGALAFLNFQFDPEAAFTWETFIFGAALGGMFVFTFFAFTKAVTSAGAALATVSSRLAVVIPVVLSIIIYREIPNAWQTAGIGFALVTIWFFYKSLRSHGGGAHSFADYFFLFVLMAGIGVNDFAMKVFQEWRPLLEKPFFLFMIFTSAFVYTSVIVLVKRIPVDRPSLVRGMALGVPNVFSSFFLLLALERVSAVIVYPVVNISIILLTAVAVALLWGERLNRYGIAALVAGMISIVLCGM